MAFVLFLLIHCAAAHAQKPGAWGMGIPFEGTAGKFNTITDVKAVEVDRSTTISGTGKNI